MTRAFGVTLLAAALLTGAVQVQAWRERAFPPPADEEDTVYLTSGDAIGRFAGAYTALAADVYWIRAIQYYGGTKRRLAPNALAPDAPAAIAAADANEYRQLYAMLDITTTLDPRFNIAYRFGAVFLGEPYPSGAGRPDLAIRLLQKGIRARPDKWEYMEDIAFVHYWYLHDFRGAAEWFARAAEVPGAPWWLRSMAATTMVRGGDRQTSRAMWESIRDSAQIDWLRRDAERRLAQLRALDDIDALQPVVDAYARQHGTPPSDWIAVARERGWRRLPTDPVGVPYDLTPEGRVQVSQRSSLWPMPDEPQQTDAGPAPSGHD